MKLKFSSLKNKVLIIFFGILIIIFLNFYQKEVKNFFYLISSPIQKILWETGGKISLFFETIREIRNLKKENEEFRLRIQELLAENIALKELKKENQILREALGLGLEKEYQLILAQVIGKDIEQDLLLINKGFQDGLSENLPVITQEKILVGKISEVYKNFSKILLISNPQSSFDAKIAEREILGLVKGKGNLKIFLDFIPQEKEIKKEDLVITSALGGIFPAGLLVGQIGEVKKSDLGLFQQAEILPFFEIKEIETLFIIANFQRL